MTVIEIEYMGKKLYYTKGEIEPDESIKEGYVVGLNNNGNIVAANDRGADKLMLVVKDEEGGIGLCAVPEEARQDLEFLSRKPTKKKKKRTIIDRIK